MRIALASLAAGLSLAASAQLQPAPAFDAAVVRPAAANARRSFRIAPGSLTAEALPLHSLIVQAYGVSEYELKGVSGWMDSEQYSITARASGPADRAELMLMLRALLADRFHLKTHQETRKTPVYALVTASGGSKLRPLQDGESAPPQQSMQSERIAIPIGQTIPDLIRFLNTRGGDIAIGRLVVDRTGMEGKYKIALEFDNVVAPDGKSGRMDGDIPSSLSQQLGLKLQPAEADVTFLVIESAERPRQ